MHAGLHCARCALRVGHQRHDVEALYATRESHQFCSVGHLREKGWWHEAPYLDFLHAGGGFGRDLALALFQRHDLVDRLQAVTGTDFGDEDASHG